MADGATREHTRQRALRAATTEQRSQTAFSPKTLRAAGLLPVAGVGSFLTARCGDARNSPPWPRPKSLAAGLLLILKQALDPNPRSSVSQMKNVLRSLKSLAFPFIRSEPPRIQRPRPKSRFVRAHLDPTACPQAGASAERPAEAKP